MAWTGERELDFITKDERNLREMEVVKGREKSRHKEKKKGQEMDEGQGKG